MLLTERETFLNCCQGNLEDSGGREHEDNIIVIPVRCTECGRFYSEVYKLAHVKNENNDTLWRDDES